jgi:hypothetical protein
MATLSLCTASEVTAQELTARTYANAPVGLNFAGIGYGLSSGSVLVDPSLPIDDLDADLRTLLLRYTRTLDVFGKSGKVKVILPYSWADFKGVLVGGERRQREVSGLGDARLIFEVNVVGAPALDRREFAAFRQKTIVGMSLGILLPSGHYNPDKLINLGGNRWSCRPAVGVSRAVRKWVFEVAATAWLFADNDDFFGGVTLRQDPIYELQAHAIYNFRPGLWLAVSGGYADGGETTVDEEIRNDLQNNTRSGVALAYPLSRRQGLLFTWSTGLATRIGADFDSYAVAYQVMWGGGSGP